MKLKIYIVLAALWSVISINAQDVKISGVVTSFNRYPLKGVLVETKKSKETVKTDSLGRFEIRCNVKDNIVLSAAGFIGQRSKINDDSPSHLQVNLVLLGSSSAQNKAVAEGYMTQGDMDYAIENLIDENNDYYKYATICDLLQSKFPSARCDEVNGANRIFLGSQPQSIGSGSWALCVVDGVITEDISDIVPMQVRTIQVLSKADAASWGVRGGNGVLEITLKSK